MKAAQWHNETKKAKLSGYKITWILHVAGSIERTSQKCVHRRFLSLSEEVFFSHHMTIKTNSHQILFIPIAQNHNHIAAVGFTVCTVNDIPTIQVSKMCHIEEKTF